jgi:hypothetical protein
MASRINEESDMDYHLGFRLRMKAATFHEAARQSRTLFLEMQVVRRLQHARCLTAM